MQTEFEFTLPHGYVDEAGQVHRHGRIRLAYALDEIEAFEHPRVQAQASYLPVVLLSRVIVQLGTLAAVNGQTIERLFAADLLYLEELYLRLNSANAVLVQATCPHCLQLFQLQVAPLHA